MNPAPDKLVPNHALPCGMPRIFSRGGQRSRWVDAPAQKPHRRPAAFGLRSLLGRWRIATASSACRGGLWQSPPPSQPPPQSDKRRVPRTHRRFRTGRARRRATGASRNTPRALNPRPPEPSPGEGRRRPASGSCHEANDIRGGNPGQPESVDRRLRNILAPTKGTVHEEKGQRVYRRLKRAQSDTRSGRNAQGAPSSRDRRPSLSPSTTSSAAEGSSAQAKRCSFQMLASLW